MLVTAQARAEDIEMETFEPYLPKLLDHVGELTGDWSLDAAYPWRNVLEFSGPGTAYCFNDPYATLTEHGIKAEGDGFAGPKVFNEAEAWFLFNQQLLEYTKGAKQVAWRRYPTLGGDPHMGAMHVTARLAVYR